MNWDQNYQFPTVGNSLLVRGASGQGPDRNPQYIPTHSLEFTSATRNSR